MGDVHLIGNLAHLLDEAAKRFALDIFRHGVNDGAKLGAITVGNIGKQLSTLPFLESSVCSFKNNG